jgi:DNA-binding CsgD family transcriptional regulator
MKRDFLAAIETVYRSDLETDEAWLAALLQSLQPSLDAGLGLNGLFVDASDPRQVHYSDPIGCGSTEDMRAHIGVSAAELAPDVQRRALIGQSSLVTTLSAIAGIEELNRSPIFREHYQAGGLMDALTLVATDATGRGCIVAVGLPKIGRVPRALDAPLSRVAIHALTALRLRRALGRRTISNDGDAVLSPSGRVEHATGEAKERDALEDLREAARGIDQARRLRKDDPAASTELWKGLASGRWSLVDRFERDGRRYLIAMRNDSAQARIAGLTVREAQVVALVGLGRSSKLVGYELGLSAPTVSRLLASAMAKLGVRSRTALAKRLASLLESKGPAESR